MIPPSVFPPAVLVALLLVVGGLPLVVVLAADANLCFADRDELKAAVDRYVDDAKCTSGVDGSGCAVGQTYGWPMNEWNVSEVTDLAELFELSSFDGNLSAWDVSRVTDMGSMFAFATAFNGDLSEWDTSSVRNMEWMFSYARAFNGDVSEWDTSSVTDMKQMFGGARAFNGNVSGWDTASVTNMDSMFYGAWAFNGDVSSWDISSVTTMRGMFNNAEAFNQNLCAWGDEFPYGREDTSGIFRESGCYYTRDPATVGRFKGPFCASACSPYTVTWRLEDQESTPLPSALPTGAPVATLDPTHDELSANNSSFSTEAPSASPAFVPRNTSDGQEQDEDVPQPSESPQTLPFPTVAKIDKNGASIDGPTAAAVAVAGVFVFVPSMF